MSEGLLYEPRSFWSVANVRATQGDVITNFRMDRRHFYNGSRYPVEIRRLAIMGVNYTFMESPAGNEPFTGSTVINACRLAVSFPQRFHLNSKRLVLDAAISPRPTWLPPVDPAGGAGGEPLSSIWGQTMLKFDNPLYLPIDGTIVWELSAMMPWGNGIVQQDPNSEIPATMLFQEDGGLLPGSARTFATNLRVYDSDNALQTSNNPLEGWPFPLGPFQVPAPANGGSTNWWPPQTAFNAQIFDRQESTRAGSTKLSDMRLFIDQRQYDLDLFNSVVGGAGASPQPSPLSMRLGSRVRTRNAGTKEWWWRPGAPVALTFDHITPANVYELPEPITMGPGEQVDIEMEFPPGTFGEGELVDFHVGVALNGFAVIEG